jgi:hypothetical protein
LLLELADDVTTEEFFERATVQVVDVNLWDYSRGMTARLNWKP